MREVQTKMFFIYLFIYSYIFLPFRCLFLPLSFVESLFARSFWLSLIWLSFQVKQKTHCACVHLCVWCAYTKLTQADTTQRAEISMSLLYFVYLVRWNKTKVNSGTCVYVRKANLVYIRDHRATVTQDNKNEK